MRIEIAERLRPFSHLPGTSFVLPGSSLGVVVFPALIRVRDLKGPLPVSLAEIVLDLEGPVEDFTVLLDLENGKLKVWGKSAKGYFRYIVKALKSDLGVVVAVEKGPEEGIGVKCSGQLSTKTTLLKAHEETVFSQTPISHESCLSFDSLDTVERLSLGSHKLQDWELVCRRSSFAEIFPIWHRLGQVTPQQAKQLTGTALLLEECRQAIVANAPEKILNNFRRLFLTSFDGVLSPRLVDTNFQGIICKGQDLSYSSDEQGSALALLSEGALLIRSLFIQEKEQSVHVLPALPPEFHCGRLLRAKCGKQGSLTMEWTKKSIRCMTFSSLEDHKMAFFFSNHEKTCRLRHSYKDKGVVYVPGTQLDVIANQNYWFDNFQR